MEPVKPAPDLDRKLVAVFAADVVGYSRLMEQDESGTLATLSSHRNVLDGLIDEHGGRITSTAGDSVMAEFGSVINAVACAVEVQEALHVANASLATRLEFRIGINVGDVIVKDEDIFGDGVNVAARLETLSEPGGVCVSRGVRDYIDKLTPFTFDDLGEQAVKNIAAPIRAFAVRFEDGRAVLNRQSPPLRDNDKPIELVDASDEVAIELAFWETVKDSDSIAELTAYVEKYPNGSFVELAQIRLAELSDD